MDVLDHLLKATYTIVAFWAPSGARSRCDTSLHRSSNHIPTIRQSRRRHANRGRPGIMEGHAESWRAFELQWRGRSRHRCGLRWRSNLWVFIPGTHSFMLRFQLNTGEFQAFRDHKIVDVFEEPGSADLTANVDFAYLREAISDLGMLTSPLTSSV